MFARYCCRVQSIRFTTLLKSFFDTSKEGNELAKKSNKKTCRGFCAQLPFFGVRTFSKSLFFIINGRSITNQKLVGKKTAQIIFFAQV
jgi:hypothetical protein